MVDNLLIVEDNKALAKIMALHIAKNSVYNVILAHSFEEAKAIMIKNHFLAALLDLNLPDAPNGEIVDEALSKGIPSIVLTGNFDQATRELILKKPIIDYVYKEKISDINDTYGHPVGDDVIKMVANAIKSHSRATDVVARIGGEEFCLLLKSTDEKHAYKIVEEIRQDICSGEFVSKRGESFAVTISAGLSTKPADSSEEMLDESDALLYKAKTSGKNRVCIG